VDVWEVGFELLANPQEVGVYRVRLDVVAHIDCEEAEGVRCGFNRHIVHANEGKVGVQSGSVVLPSADIDHLPESNCSFSYQMLL